MINVLIIMLHLIVCVALILIVLLQTGKGASMGAMFGGAGNQTLFGNTGASTFLSKATTVAAVIFMLTSLTLAYISTGGTDSVVNDYHPPASTELPMPGSDNLPPPAAQAPVAAPQDKQTATQPVPASPPAQAPVANNPTAPPVEK